MLDRVGQGFLDDSIQRHLGCAGEAPGKCHLDMDGQIGALRNPFGQEADRRNPSKIVQNRWPKFVGIPPQLLFNLVEQFFNPPHLLFVTFRQFPRDVGERKMHGHQKLPGLVVHGIRDPLDFFLQRFIEVPQRRDRILHSAVRHFVRGEHLCQEISSRLQQFLVPRRSLCLAKHPVDGLMMHEGDFHEALFLGDGAAPQLVGPA